MKKYKLVVCGGTFDYFHKGHRDFLSFAFSLSEKVIIGISSSFFAKEKLQKEVEDFNKRKLAVSAFLQEEKLIDRSEIVELKDFYGLTLEDIPLEAIIVTENTLKGAEIINEKRKELGLKPLNMEILPQTLAVDGQELSSSRIRKGEIDKEGKVFMDSLWFEKKIYLPEKLRDRLKVPFGTLIENFEDEIKNNSFINSITVGDVVTSFFNAKNLKQKISVVDFYVERQKKYNSLEELGFSSDVLLINAINPRGMLTPSLFRSVEKAFDLIGEKKVVVFVDGEEDLAVLPVILFAPYGFKVYYGQPGKGVVEVAVDLESKKKARDIIAEFRPDS